MKDMEIERKFTIGQLPCRLERFAAHRIEQAYLNVNPVVRIRRQDNEYYLTYKGKGLLVREEYNLPLNKESYEHLLEKADGIVISKTRYLIPLSPQAGSEETNSAGQELMIELDVFDAPLAPLVIAEVEFPDKEAADRFIPPPWFTREVTWDPAFHNSNLSTGIVPGFD